METIIEANNITKQYGSTKALDNLNMKVYNGVTGLLGPNGAGKSTAMRIFLGLTEPTSGDARVLGQNIFENPHVRKRIGYMPEHSCLPTNTPGAYFLTHMAEVSGLPRRMARSRAADTLRHVGIYEERYRPIKDYSLGMTQRIKLAQAIVHDPILLFLDEPTAGLDPTGRVEMLELLKKTFSEFGINILITSHLLRDITTVCDSVIVIDNGKVTRTEELEQFSRATETLFIEVTDNQDSFVEILKRQNVNVSVEGYGGVITVHDVSDSAYDVIRDALVEANAPIQSMTPYRRALKDIFKSDDVKDSVHKG